MIDHVHALPEGYRLQEYTITGTLGFGGFGISYSALDNNLDKIMAIKEYLPSDLAVRVEGSTVSAKSEQDKDSFDWGLERFLEEARTVAKFDHPNIVKIHRFFEQNGTGYIVMEFIEGSTLDALLKERGTLEENEIRSWLWPVMDGLQIVHERGYLHRDIKPQNIMMHDDGSPVLLDFGAARLAMGGVTRSLTSIMTPGFAPLEQYQTKGQGPWTDIYGLAAVMYKCVAGVKPQDALDRVTDDSLEPPDQDTDKTYSPGLIRGIVAGLAVHAGERPQSLDEWLAILNEEGSEQTRRMPKAPGPAQPGPTPQTSPGPDRKEVSQEPEAGKSMGILKWLLLGVLLVLIGAMAIYWWLDGQKTEPATPPSEPPVQQEPVQADIVQEEALAEPTPELAAPVFTSGQVFRDCADCPEMVVIPAGSFQMGSPADERDRNNNEGPQHRVTFKQPFALGKYEVTFDEYDVFAQATNRDRPKDKGWGRGNRPAIYVSWKDSDAYVNWLSKRTGKRYRLPSESEWEYAARAGTQSRYWWGDEIDQNRANCRGCGSRWDNEQTAPVVSFEASPFALHDMHGNVWEWVEDCWQENYSDTPSDGAPRVSTGDCSRRVVRGGSWDTWPKYLRSAYRNRYITSYRFFTTGFRVAQDLPP